MLQTVRYSPLMCKFIHVQKHKWDTISLLMHNNYYTLAQTLTKNAFISTLIKSSKTSPEKQNKPTHHLVLDFVRHTTTCEETLAHRFRNNTFVWPIYRSTYLINIAASRSYREKYRTVPDTPWSQRHGFKPSAPCSVTTEKLTGEFKTHCFQHNHISLAG